MPGSSLVSQVPSALVWAGDTSMGGHRGYRGDVEIPGFVEWANVLWQGGLRGNLGFALAGMER